MEPSDTLVYIGDAVKALDDGGKVHGDLVRYGTPSDVDLTGDYFDSATDFDVDEWPHKSRVYYQHGLDTRLKHRKLGNGEMRQDEIGVWVEAQLALRDEYEKAIFELVKQGKMGWSSGTAGHLVDRESKGASHRITHWPLGLDASITPTPAEYRNSAVSLKSLLATESTLLLPETDSGIPLGTVVQSEPQENAASVVVPAVLKKIPEEIMPQETSVLDLHPDLLKTITHATIDAWKAMQKEEEEKKSVNDAMFQTPTDEDRSVKAIELRQRKDELQAIRTYIKDADHRAYQAWFNEAIKASNATDMNIGTPADGGYVVPVGHYQRIIARRDEMALDNRLGLLPIPGKGTTVNVPLDAGAANVFIATNEAAAFDLDAPVLGQKAMTLVKYTKKLQLSIELIEDEDSQLMPFLEDYVGRAAGLTANSALLTKVLAGGTVVPLTGVVAAAAHIPKMVYALPDEYADGAQWIMRRATEGSYRELQGNNWQFNPTPPFGTSQTALWGFPINHSQFTAAIAASAKTMVLGNFSYVGKRQVNQMTFLRDPYGAANTGQINLYYYMRFVYEVLQAGPILVGQLASAEAMHLFVFTPVTPAGLRPETVRSITAQQYRGLVTWTIGRCNPYPPPDMRNVLAQYERGRELFLSGPYDAMVTIEQDMTMPPHALETLVSDGAEVVYGTYMLRHGTPVLNALSVDGGVNPGMSLTLGSPLGPAQLRHLSRLKRIEVSGMGFGCTLIRRQVVERIPFRADDPATPPDMPFARDCLRMGIRQIARFDVRCGHIHEGEILETEKSNDGMVTVTAKQDCSLLIDGKSVTLLEGEQVEMPAQTAAEYAALGYVEIGAAKTGLGDTSPKVPRR